MFAIALNYIKSRFAEKTPATEKTVAEKPQGWQVSCHCCGWSATIKIGNKDFAEVIAIAKHRLEKKQCRAIATPRDSTYCLV